MSTVGRGALRAVWEELGTVGRIAFVGVVVSAIVAITLGFLIPEAVRGHLIDARIDELSRAVEAVATAAPERFSTGADYREFSEEVRLRVLGGDTVRVKLWDATGQVLWSDAEALIGRRFSPGTDIELAFEGDISVEVTDLGEPENEFERQFESLIEYYIPVRDGTGEVGAVFEVYQRLEPLRQTLDEVRAAAWIRIGTGLGALSVFMGALTLVTVRGVERRRSQSEALLRRSLEIREAERIRLANALHDDVGQPLYRLVFGLDALRQANLSEERAGEELARLRAIVNDIDATLRGELRDLQRSPVAHRGLEAALLDLRSPEGVVPSVFVSVDETAGGSTGEVDEVIYRAAREAVSNALRHAGGSEIEVRLDASGSETVMSVSDNGRWSEGAEGLGLATTRALVEGLGGRLELSRRRSGGTVLTVRMPGGGAS
jgi:signal transduction histidine kinase